MKNNRGCKVCIHNYRDENTSKCLKGLSDHHDHWWQDNILKVENNIDTVDHMPCCTMHEVSDVQLIMETVAKVYGFRSYKELLVKDRQRKLSEPRQLAMALTRLMCNISLYKTGELFNITVGTVVHSLKVWQSFYLYNKKRRSLFCETVAMLTTDSEPICKRLIEYPRAYVWDKKSNKKVLVSEH